MFWPSFNSALLDILDEKKKALFNTYYALAVSMVTAISVSALTHPQGKINMVRRGPFPWAALGSSRPDTHIHTPPASLSASATGRERAYRVMGSCLQHRGASAHQHCLVKMGLKHRRLSNEQRPSGGSD